MEKIENMIRETYKCLDHIIEISETGETWEAYINDPGYGIKMFMFGAMKGQITLAEFVEAVDVQAEDYVKQYAEQYEN